MCDLIGINGDAQELRQENQTGKAAVSTW